MSTTPEGGEARRRPVMAFGAYGIVVALLVGAGVALWTTERGGRPDPASSRRTVQAGSKTTEIDAPRQDRGQAAPVGSAEAAEAAPARREPQPETAVVSPPPPPQSEASDKTAAAPTSQKPEPEPAPAPALARCTLDAASWPTDRTEQAKAVQILLRDLGFYSGTTYGTLGPATRAAIARFQVAAGEAETGEPSEALFAALKKKCAP